MAIQRRVLDCFAALAMATLSTSCARSEPSGALLARVDDQAALLSDAVEHRITERLDRLERRTSDQVAVKTVNSLGGETIEEFSLATARSMQLGTATKDNGVLLLVAPEERKLRIETGCGMAGVLTDDEAGNIVRAMASHFRNGSFEQGIELGVQRIDEELSEHPSGPLRMIRDKRCNS